MSSLQGKVVFITGASSGLGAICAQMLVEKGAVPILTARSADRLQHISSGLNGKHEWFVLDVTDNEQVFHVIDLVLSQYGRIDILLNNAGYGKFERMTDMAVSEFQSMMDVNYMGAVHCIKAVLPGMLERGSGQIVNVASMAGKIGTAKSASYTATKHAVIGLSNALRQELRGTGITVSTINPGPIDTPFFDLADPSGGYVGSIRWFMMKAERVAKHMISAMEKHKEEVNLPYVAAAGIKLYSLFPRLADRLTYRMMNKK
ncbi:SDR family oxidoreductase [Paenibacillus sp. P96]|uniref:SDR family oxidoreductase n=1 Tax=Paenibacillus zeirhizosphaerae TaxID=2987519 RepID=A0ABT9FV32_9BACL|nr:SDR family oxidoreductase [Paenibacillus sp. P96]MDP4098465.1 SDR family oxidoreductase [Paenibacillus sp. P96]